MSVSTCHFGHAKSEWGALGRSYLQVKPENKPETQSDWFERKLLPTFRHGQQEGFVLTWLIATLQVVQGMGLCSARSQVTRGAQPGAVPLGGPQLSKKTLPPLKSGHSEEKRAGEGGGINPLEAKKKIKN